MFLFTTPSAPEATAPPKPHEAALKAASERTGVSFDYLLATARRESGLKADARAATSSASGLFQFIEQTWFGLIKSDGATHGLGEIASQVQRSQSGRLYVEDAQARAQILALRNDPEIAARFAGVLASRNRDSLAGALGREPTQGELYIAHFLGSSAASRLIRLRQEAPDTAAAGQFPAAAAANRPVFFARSGQARSIGEVYDRLVAGFGEAPGVTADSSVAASTGNPFHNLFRQSSTQPVARSVARTWVPLAQASLSRTPLTIQPESAAAPRAAGAIGKPLDLSTFLRIRSSHS